jgi:uncharacterized protein (DUF4415 family)
MGLFGTQRSSKLISRNTAFVFPTPSQCLKTHAPLTVADYESDSEGEERFVTLGYDSKGRILVVVYAWSADDIRLISAREAEPHERGLRKPMKDQYDFGKGKRGAVIPTPASKERITIRLDADILDYFRGQVERAGGGNYQTAINSVLREYLDGKTAAPQLEDIVRRVIREELRRAS